MMAIDWEKEFGFLREPGSNRFENLMGIIGHTIDIPARGVRSGVGNIMGKVAQTSLPVRGQRELLELERQGASGEEKFGAIQRDVENLGPLSGIANLSAEMLTDPFNYIGLGLFKRAASLTSAIPDPLIRTGVERTLLALNHADEATSRFLGQAAVSPFKLTRFALSKLPSPGMIVTEFGTKETAKSFDEWLNVARSAASQGRLYAEKVYAATEYLRRRGYAYYEALADASLGGEFLPAYRSTKAGIAFIDKLGIRLRADLEKIDNPFAKASGGLLWARAEKVARSAWEQAFVTRQELINLHKVDVSDIAVARKHNLLDEYHQIRGAFKDAYETAGRAYLAAHHTAQQMVSRLNKLDDVPGPIGLAQRQYFADLSDTAFKRINEIITDFGGRLEHLPVDEQAAIIKERNDQLDIVFGELAAGLGESGEMLASGAGRLLSRRLDQLDYLSRGHAAIAADLPERLTDTRFADDLLKSFQEVQPAMSRDLGMILKALREAWEHSYNLRDIPVPKRPPIDWRGQDIDDIAERLDDVNTVLEDMGLPLVNSGQELLNIFTSKFPRTETPILRDTTRAAVVQAMTRWGKEDILLADPHELVRDRVTRTGIKARFGHEPTTAQGKFIAGIGGILGGATQAWKSILLATPTYLLTNWISGLSMSALGGYSASRTLGEAGTRLARTGAALVEGMDALHTINPVKYAQRLTSNFQRSLSGQITHNLETDALFGPSGIDIPIPRLQSTTAIRMEHAAVHEFDLESKAILDKIGKGRMAVGMGALGLAGGGPLGGITGLIYGFTLPKISEITRWIGAATEITLREVIMDQHLVKQLREATPTLFTHVERALAQQWRGVVPKVIGGPVPTGALDPGQFAALIRRRKTRLLGGRDIITRGIDPEAQRVALAELRTLAAEKEGVISSREIQDILLKAGLDPRDARLTGKWWDNELDIMAQKSAKEAGRVQVDYESLSNFEEFMRTYVPFSTWAIKAYPFFLSRLMERPIFAISLWNLNKIFADQLESGGLSNRFEGAGSFPAGDFLVSLLLGRDVRAFYNPLRGFVPFSETRRGIEAIGEEDSFPGVLLKVLEAFGLSAHPLIQTAERAFQADAPARGLIRHAAPIKALTGVDLNAPIIGAERAVRRALTGREVVDLDEQSIIRRIDELALRDTGQPSTESPSGAPYLLAQLRKEGPIWDKAKEEVGREAGFRSLTGLFYQGITPQALLTREEEAIRRAKKPPEQGGQFITFSRELSDKLQSLAGKGLGAQAAPPELVEEARRQAEAFWGDPLPAVIADKLEGASPSDPPTISELNWLRKALYNVQIKEDPLRGAYSAGGSPEKANLSRLVTIYNSPEALLLMDPQLSGMFRPEQLGNVRKLWETYKGVQDVSPALARKLSSGEVGSAWLLQRLNANRQAFRTANPMLDQFLGYMAQTKGEGSLNEFLKALGID